MTEEKIIKIDGRKYRIAPHEPMIPISSYLDVEDANGAKGDLRREIRK